MGDGVLVSDGEAWREAERRLRAEVDDALASNAPAEPDDVDDLAGYRIPAGTLVSIPVWAVHRDARRFEGPETFDPGRWDREVDRPRFAFFPFGGGPRGCIGEAFARLEATLVLATLARRVELAPLREDLAFSPAITAQPTHEMPMRVRRRG